MENFDQTLEFEDFCDKEFFQGNSLFDLNSKNEKSESSIQPSIHKGRKKYECKSCDRRFLSVSK